MLEYVTKEGQLLIILSFTGLFFELGDASYLNNTVILVDEIGEGDSALLCRTNNTGCCGSSFTPFRGEFYYPNSNNVVPTAGVSPNFYRNRGTGFIRLNRQPNTDIQLGEYRCEIPDYRGIRQNLFINIGKPIRQLSELSYTGNRCAYTIFPSQFKLSLLSLVQQLHHHHSQSPAHLHLHMTISIVSTANMQKRTCREGVLSIFRESPCMCKVHCISRWSQP